MKVQLTPSKIIIIINSFKDKVVKNLINEEISEIQPSPLPPPPPMQIRLAFIFFQNT